MTVSGRLSPVEREARTILETEGYRVTPMRPCFVSRYKPVNLMAMRMPDELIYIKLRQTARLPDDPAALAEFCRDDSRLLRTLFPLDTEVFRLKKEIWVRPLSGGFCCFEILPDGMHAVTHDRSHKSTH
ncbi:hypothetical protein [uncultured Methanoregula sp.]|uniref:hypothetical protein n=1 Tax=uncultured Methanoregula sp. TaxID=1005933 RepID=UPI002AAB52B1|nr:hypothetical protein [uncultured Methanoregula sp.]